MRLSENGAKSRAVNAVEVDGSCSGKSILIRSIRSIFL